MKKTILITAGPTKEHIDPIRFISNESTGVLGNEIARVACEEGNKVIVITGNAQLPIVRNVKYVYIESARDLEREIRKYIYTANVLFMTSAVCDFRPIKIAQSKIKREKGKDIVLRLRPNKDILKTLSHSRIKKDKTFVGFCIETNNIVHNARKKLIEKKLDFIVATKYSKTKSPFGNQKMGPIILGKNGGIVQLKAISKDKLAQKLMALISR
ncbi:phosphopantothenoylcysteine decarboxylase [Candidatus Omnitrophota bacterium]